MKPMISPWTIYFASRADAVGTLFLIVAVAAFAICLIGFDDLTKNGFKLFISIGIISVILTVLTPTTETVYTSINFYHSFNYFDDEYLKIDNNWDFMIRTHEYHRYLIIDNYGNVRDFYQLTKKYKKKYYRTYHKHHGWNIHWASTVPDQRKSITPEEIVEVRNEYGITLKPIKPKRKTDSWDHVRGLKVSGWKMQSKRRKQWKPMEGI